MLGVINGKYKDGTEYVKIYYSKIELVCTATPSFGSRFSYSVDVDTSVVIERTDDNKLKVSLDCTGKILSP